MTLEIQVLKTSIMGVIKGIESSTDTCIIRDNPNGQEEDEFGSDILCKGLNHRADT